MIKKHSISSPSNTTAAIPNTASNDSAASVTKAWTSDKRHRPMPPSSANAVQSLIHKANSATGRDGLADHPLSNDRLMLKREILRYIPVSPKTWERWVENGTLPSYIRLGAQRFWRASDIHAWIEAHS